MKLRHLRAELHVLLVFLVMLGALTSSIYAMEQFAVTNGGSGVQTNTSQGASHAAQILPTCGSVNVNGSLALHPISSGNLGTSGNRTCGIHIPPPPPPQL